MAKDLIIGGISNYGWDDVKYWVNSIKKSDFKGDIVLVAGNITKETIEKLVEEGVKLSIYGHQQDDGNFRTPSGGVPHVERFFYIYNFLRTAAEDYGIVIATDVRDVVFQYNPTVWMEDNFIFGRRNLIVPSEGLKYKDEVWNSNNLNQALGPFFHKVFEDMEICNVGIIAGENRYVRDLMLMLFQLSINRPIPVVDQVMFNFMINQLPWKLETHTTHNGEAWVANMGATLAAIQSGHGDIAQQYGRHQSGERLYGTKYMDDQPYIDEDGVVLTKQDGPQFCIVHQYDRVNGLKELVEKRYG
jgi:hypothetical protein